MKEITLRVPDVMLLAGTRVALGVGIGLLVARRLGERERKGAGLALLAVGALTTIPIVLSGRARSRERLAAESGRTVRHAGPGSERRDAGGFREQPMQP